MAWGCPRRHPDPVLSMYTSPEADTRDISMSSEAETTKIGVEDYLAGEQHSTIKHEYVAGEVFAMAGANEAHVTIAGNGRGL